ncbi:MAG: hypothetical protein ACSHXK_10310 [Oceanococcus sp.]
MTALLALLRKYRQRLARIVFAITFALVSHWAYPDLAQFAQQQHPQWLVWLLAGKTLILFVALFVVLWQLNRMIQGDDAQAPQTTARRDTAPGSDIQASSKLDELLDKPRLRHRKDELLTKD